jgi:hypothetical protein
MNYLTEFKQDRYYLIEDFLSYKVAKVEFQGNVPWFNVGSYYLKATSCKAMLLDKHQNHN